MTLEHFISKYENNDKVNDDLYSVFTELTNSIEYLKNHRDYIENNNLGFGERAFQFMWYLIFKYLANNNEQISVLEIGVFKGQIISLWSLIGKKENIKVDVSGITPLEGNPKTKNIFLNKVKSILSKKYRNDLMVGNNFDNSDYYEIIKSVFHNFSLNISNLNLIKGYSNDERILFQIKDKKYDIIYIDGDHSFSGALNDIINYSPKVNKNGFLVIDDASSNIPGTIFWKGIQEVSDAAENVNLNEFKNVLNIGHNRIYQKL
jgi:hypothetical protein